MKPKPVHTETVCSVCGLDWDRHSKETVVECVELLKADLAREKLRTTPQPAIPYYPVVPYPYPARPFTPYPQRWIYPNWISQPNITSGGISVTGVTTTANTLPALNSGSGNYQ